jgi:hypothetical protein
MTLSVWWLSGVPEHIFALAIILRKWLRAGAMQTVG